MKILVTGANGFLGRGIVEKLVEAGNEVVATDFKTDLVTKQAERIDGNLFELADPYEHFGQPDVLLHLAYRNGFVLNAPSHFEDLSQHAKFLEKMVNGGIKRLAVMGTMHEIGFYEGSVKADTPTHPMNQYGIAKDALRNYAELLSQQHNVDLQWLRAFYIVANTGYGNSIFSKLYTAAENGETEFPFTTGKTQYDFLDYETFATYVARAVSQDAITGIINISSGEPMRLAERVEQFITENKLAIKLNYGAFPDRPFDSKAIWGDSKKIDAIMAGKAKHE